MYQENLLGFLDLIATTILSFDCPISFDLNFLSKLSGGTCVFACDPNMRAYLKKHIQTYVPEPKIKVLILDQVKPFESAVPLYDIYATVGNFSKLQDFEGNNYSEMNSWVELPHPLKASKDYFACEVRGESMNKRIPNSSLCLYKKDSGGSRNEK